MLNKVLCEEVRRAAIQATQDQPEMQYHIISNLNWQQLCKYGAEYRAYDAHTFPFADSTPPLNYLAQSMCF